MKPRGTYNYHTSTQGYPSGFILQNEYVAPWDLHLLHIHSGRFKKYGLQNDLTSSLTLKDIQNKLLNVLTSSFTHLQVVHLFGSV